MDKAVSGYFPTTTSFTRADESKPYDAVNNPNVSKVVQKGLADLAPEARKFYGDAKPWVLAARARRIDPAVAKARVEELKPKLTITSWPYMEDVNAAYNALIGGFTPTSQGALPVAPQSPPTSLTPADDNSAAEIQALIDSGEDPEVARIAVLGE